MKRVLRVFGVPVLSYETIHDQMGVEIIHNVGGEFDLAPVPEEQDYEEEDRFGFSAKAGS